MNMYLSHAFVCAYWELSYGIACVLVASMPFRLAYPRQLCEEPLPNVCCKIQLEPASLSCLTVFIRSDAYFGKHRARYSSSSPVVTERQPKLNVA
jgi:hypothetical protein